MPSITFHKFKQHTPEWEKIRCGRLTASVLDKILTPAKLQISVQAKDFAMVKAAERIKGKAEDMPVTFDMERGTMTEEEVRSAYEENFGLVEQFGFMENADVPFPFGASPDGIIDGRKGGVQIKCPKACHHLSHLLTQGIDGGYLLQMQGEMLAGGLEYNKFLSFNEGMKFIPFTVWRDDSVIEKIVTAGAAFEEMVLENLEKYKQLGGVEIGMPEELE